MEKRLLAALVCALLASCSSQTNVRSGFSGGAVVPAAGTSVSGAQVGVQVQSGSAAGAVLALGLLAVVLHGTDEQTPPWHAGASFPAVTSSVPPLDESRRVNEQSCTRPIEDGAANLRCR